MQKSIKSNPKCVFLKKNLKNSPYIVKNKGSLK